MKRTKSTFLALIAILMSPITANAIPIVITTDCPTETTFTCITGINSLEILGSEYDMTVTIGTFDTLFPNPETDLLTWGDSTFAAAANSAIAAAINLLSPRPTSADTKFFDLGSSIEYWERTLHSPTNFDTLGFGGPCSLISSSQTAAGTCGSWSRDWTLAFALLTPTSSVPEPGTFALLGIGLVGMGLTRRRRKI